MLYVLRLSTGDCVITAASDESTARELASTLQLEPDETIASVRPLARLAIRLTPNDSGSLDVNAWDDSTLDDILQSEYPLLYAAFRRANSVPLLSSPDKDLPLLNQLKQANEENAEIIRTGLRLEQKRLNPQTDLQAQKVARE